MPAYLHSLSFSQADKEISFVHPRTSVAGVISVPLLPVTFPCGSVRCRKRGLHLTLPQLNRLLSLLANDRKLLVLHQQFGNPNMMCQNITQLSEYFKHKYSRDAMNRAVPELQAISSLLLSSKASFFLSFCLLPSFWKLTKVPETNTPRLQWYVDIFVPPSQVLLPSSLLPGRK